MEYESQDDKDIDKDCYLHKVWEMTTLEHQPRRQHTNDDLKALKHGSKLNNYTI